jgi:hypothetical protein
MSPLLLLVSKGPREGLEIRLPRWQHDRGWLHPRAGWHTIWAQDRCWAGSSCIQGAGVCVVALATQHPCRPVAHSGCLLLLRPKHWLTMWVVHLLDCCGVGMQAGGWPCGLH